MRALARGPLNTCVCVRVYTNNNNNTSITSESLKCQDDRRKKQNDLRNHKRGQAKSSLERGTADNLWWENNFKQICLEGFCERWL